MKRMILPLLFIMGFSSVAFAQVLSIKVNDAAPVAVELTPTAQPNGDLKFVGEKTVSGNKFNWDITLSGTATGMLGEQIIKGSTLKVETDAAAVGATNVTVEYHLPCKAYTGIAFNGGGLVKFQCNADGGAVTCSPQPTGSTFWAPLVDGVTIENPVCAAVYCPFLMTMTGSGTGTTPIIMSQSCQGQKAKNIMGMIGERLRASITAGDKLTVSMSIGVVAFSCPEDLNGDKKVDGADQGILLGSWGTDGIGDLNKDGKVDGADLGLMLGAMGKSCQ